MTAGKTEHPARYQSVCRWSFHPGKGGFVPGNIRPEFRDMTPSGFVGLVARLEGMKYSGYFSGGFTTPSRIFFILARS
jgi:hypothetical protein